MSCSQPAQCTSNVCYPDGACGVPSGDACESNDVCRSGTCIEGFCSAPNAEIRGKGGVRCSVTPASPSGDERTSPAWALGLAALVAFGRRRRSNSSHETL